MKHIITVTVDVRRHSDIQMCSDLMSVVFVAPYLLCFQGIQTVRSEHRTVTDPIGWYEGHVCFSRAVCFCQLPLSGRVFSRLSPSCLDRERS